MWQHLLSLISSSPCHCKPATVVCTRRYISAETRPGDRKFDSVQDRVYKTQLWYSWPMT